jgi:hypothetical protein
MDIRKADAVFRRQAIALLAGALCAGVLLIAGFERYQGELAEWVRADAARTALRLELVFGVFAVVLLTPLLAMASYLRALGRRAVRTREFPPPGFRVIRDTPIVRGFDAVTRGRSLRGVAVFLTASAVLVFLFLWRLAALASRSLAK